MRLTHIVLAAVVSIFACCQGASAVSDSKSLSVPPNLVQTGNNANRFLRVHQDEEERTGAQLIKSLSEKFSTTATKLKRSKSLYDLSKLDDMGHLKPIPAPGGKTMPEVLKMDDIVYIKAAGKWTKELDVMPGGKLSGEIAKLDGATARYILDEKRRTIFQEIEVRGINPDVMLKLMKQLGKEHIDIVLLKHYLYYWMARYPTWTSSL